ncbi:hypothetical protein [Actinoplanes palleronii]|uniref:Uncharacterized protein n=1 Tax=Actinoplanes palleronii TaxID=113570 RepID=A0ABQ4B1K9_9ACTN|nr:hypothetical protein [Actinoplanes palleronii]GIE64548.1 hypothetical protein Apa02nite_006560 [Actinoplanes palleronii]
MALLNPPDIVPEAMRYLIRALFVVPGQTLTESELKDLVAPPGLLEAMAAVAVQDDEASDDEDSRGTKTTGATIVEASLGALKTLDMVSGGRERLGLGPDASSRWKQAQDVAASEFASGVLSSLLTRYELTGSPTAGAGDLVHGLSLLYAAPDPLEPFNSFDSNRGRRFVEWQKEKLGDDNSRWPLYNRERWIPLRRWAVYLGVGRLLGSALLPDASTAVERFLPLQIREYTIEEFVQQCQTMLPFIDASGSVFGHDAEEGADHAVLSPGFSLTLMALKAKGIVKLFGRSDVGGRTLRIRSDRALDQRVTHVLWEGVQTDTRRSS